MKSFESDCLQSSQKNFSGKLFAYLIACSLVTANIFSPLSMAAPLVDMEKYITFCNNYNKRLESTQCYGLKLSDFLTFLSSPNTVNDTAYMVITANEATETATNGSSMGPTSYNNKVKKLVDGLKTGAFYLYIDDRDVGVGVYIARKTLVDSKADPSNPSLLGTTGAVPYDDFGYFFFTSCSWVANNNNTSVCAPTKNEKHEDYRGSASMFVNQDFTTGSSYSKSTAPATQTTTGGLYTNDIKQQTKYFVFSETLPAYTIGVPLPTFDLSKFQIPLQVCDGDLISNAVCFIQNAFISTLNFIISLLVPSDKMLSSLEDGSSILAPLILPQGNYACDLHLLDSTQNLCWASQKLKESPVIQIGQKVSAMALLLMPIWYIINRMHNRKGDSKL